MSALRGVLVAALVAVALVPLRPAPASAAPGTATFVTAVSDGSDEVGRGNDRVWLGNDHVTVTRLQGGAIAVQASTGDDANGYTLRATFIPPSGESLTTGDYNATQSDAPAPGEAGMGVEANLDVPGTDAVKYCPDETTDNFTVHDISPDLSRLWITYEQHCWGVPDAIYGEIRYQEPNEGDLVVAPGSVVWPVSYRDVPARIVPVTVFNTGANAVDVGGAAITEDGSEFSVAHDGCMTVAAGGSCSLDVQYVPRAGGSHSGRLTIPDSTSGSPQQVPLSGRGIQPGYTSWQMHSQEGDYIGAGMEHYASPANTSIWARGDQRSIQVQVERKLGGSDDWGWNAVFEPPRGQVLTAGVTYVGATRAAFHDPGVPGLEVYGQGRGCELTGWFHIRELTMEQGQVKSFAGTFSQGCIDYPPAIGSRLVGSIAYHADRPADPVPAAPRMLPSLTVAASSGLVTDGARTTVAGRLTRGPEWNGLLHEQVILEARESERGGWTRVASTYSEIDNDVNDDGARNGLYSIGVVPRRDTEYRVRFPGDDDHLPLASRVMSVRVRWRVHLSRAYDVGHHKARLYLSVLHGHKGQVVVLQHRSGSGWARETRKRLSARGTAAFTVRLPKHGGLDRRVLVGAGDGHQGAVSEVQNVPYLGP
jgi:hypothetical protein